MKKVLIFGGLSEWGSDVTNYLLNQGLEVVAVYSTNDTDAENRALAFGRNALFEMVEEEEQGWKELGQNADALLFFNTIYCKDRQKVLNQLEYSLKHYQLEKMIVISHIEVYGVTDGVTDENTPVAPISQLGKQADELEREFIETLLKYNGESVVNELIIVRLPNLFNDNTIKEFSPSEEALHVKDMTKGIYGILMKKLKPGINVLQLSSGQDINYGDHQLCYSFKKAQMVLDFKPEITQKTLYKEK